MKGIRMEAKPLYLSSLDANFDVEFQRRLHWSADTDAGIEASVADILADVQARGDAAVLDYTARFDGLTADSVAGLELTQADFKTAFDNLPAALNVSRITSPFGGSDLECPLDFGPP